MKVKFIGANSMGYIHGEIYDLKTHVKNSLIWIKEINGKGLPCPYESIEAFSNNWVTLPKEFNVAARPSEDIWDDF